MKKLLCIASALIVALPLYAQSGAGSAATPDSGSAAGSTTIPASGSVGSGTDTSTTPMSDDMQKEEDASSVGTGSTSLPSGSSDTPSTDDDAQLEEERINSPSTVPSDSGLDAPSTVPSDSGIESDSDMESDEDSDL